MIGVLRKILGKELNQKTLESIRMLDTENRGKMRKRKGVTEFKRKHKMAI